MNQKTFTYYSWGIVALSLLLPFIAWGQNLNWQFSGLNGYQLFPLFGLLAWMVMATHYFTGYVRVKSGLVKPPYFSSVTGYFVLACLLLHPAILAYNEFVNTDTLPPESFVNYVGESLQLAVFFGSFSLLLFLSYEVFDRIRHKTSIKKNWWLVNISQTIAMTLIFIHALRLGGEISGWFLAVWIIYGLALLPCFYLFHTMDFEEKKK